MARLTVRKLVPGKSIIIPPSSTEIEVTCEAPATTATQPSGGGNVDPQDQPGRSFIDHILPYGALVMRLGQFLDATHEDLRLPADTRALFLQAPSDEWDRLRELVQYLDGDALADMYLEVWLLGDADGSSTGNGW